VNLISLLWLAACCLRGKSTAQNQESISSYREVHDGENRASCAFEMPRPSSVQLFIVTLDAPAQLAMATSLAV